MQGIAEFDKVSFNQFLQDSEKYGFVDSGTNSEIIKIIWDGIKLPARATGGSAGYDFYLPYPFFLKEGHEITIPTGIRAIIQPGWFLSLVPRSSLGFKHGMRLLNTMAVIDSDYSFAENEGHILVKFKADKNMCLQEGERFVQGLFIQHGTTRNDTPISHERNGGIGSTGVK